MTDDEILKMDGQRLCDWLKVNGVKFDPKTCYIYQPDDYSLAHEWNLAANEYWRTINDRRTQDL
jgi:hypothetical protein